MILDKIKLNNRFGVLLILIILVLATLSSLTTAYLFYTNQKLSVAVNNQNDILLNLLTGKLPQVKTPDGTMVPVLSLILEQIGKLQPPTSAFNLGSETPSPEPVPEASPE